MPVVDVAMVSSSSNIFSIKWFMVQSDSDVQDCRGGDALISPNQFKDCLILLWRGGVAFIKVSL
jgi:hypothetical protein